MASLSTVFRDTAPVEPAPYGLLSPATTVITSDEAHWQAGFEHLTTDFVQVLNVGAEGTTVSAIVVPGEGDFSREYIPFSVKVSFRASTMGNTPEEIRTVVENVLDAATQKAVEREFWTGEIAKQMVADEPDHPNLYLASAAADIVNPAVGTPVKTKYGLALLEQALGDSGIGERGVIHATRGVASALGIKGADGRIETPIGNYLVAGTGYTGSGPDGSAPTGDQAWMYATGPVTVRLGKSDLFQKTIHQAVNTSNNEIEYTGYRTAAVTWSNNSHHAVLVDLASDYA
jgi:hypothetical protein